MSWNAHRCLPWAHQQAEVAATELAHHIRILNSDHRHGAALPTGLAQSLAATS